MSTPQSWPGRLTALWRHPDGAARCLIVGRAAAAPAWLAAPRPAVSRRPAPGSPLRDGATNRRRWTRQASPLRNSKPQRLPRHAAVPDCRLAPNGRLRSAIGAKSSACRPEAVSEAPVTIVNTHQETGAS